MGAARKKTLAMIAVSTAAVLAGAAAVTALSFRGGDAGATYRGSTPPAEIALPEFTLPDYTGAEVSSAGLRGKVVLVTFLDSQCDESCPIIASQVSRAVDRLTPDERADVAAIAISTDPKEDTPSSVRGFLAANRAVGKLRYLVAPEQTLRPVWGDFQIASSLDSGIDTLHSAPVRIFNRKSVWVSTLHAGADLTTENLVHDIKTALSEGD
jgi:protein SCO1/2